MGASHEWRTRLRNGPRSNVALENIGLCRRKCVVRMNTKMNGKEIAYFSIPTDAIGDSEGFRPITGQKFVLSATFHGDHDEFWILILDTDGKELERHNCKFIWTIEWA